MFLCPAQVETATGKVKFEHNNTEALLSLRVACVNRRNGCRLLDTLQGMKEHLKQCQFQAVQCQMCGKKIKLHEVPGHARKDCSRVRKLDPNKRTQPVVQPAANPPTAAQRILSPQVAVGTAQAPPNVATSQVVPPNSVVQPNAPRQDEVAMLQQKVNKVHEDVRKMASKVQFLRDETALEMECFKKDMQKLKSEKDYAALVNAISGLRNQMKGNMAIVGEEFDSIKDVMMEYGNNIGDVGTFKESLDSTIGGIVKDIGSLKEAVEAHAMLSTTVTEMKSSIAAIHDMKYVMEFVNDFEQTLVGDIKGSSGDKKKAFTQQVEMLKRCVEVIDELKTTVKHKDMETVLNELRVIKTELSRYNALQEKMEGITSDLTGLKEVVKDAGDFAKSEPSLSEECRLELEKCRAEIKLVHEQMRRVAHDVEQLKSSSEDKDKVGFSEVVNEVCNLKAKLEDFDSLEESLQESKEDATARINALLIEVTELREKALKSRSDEKLDAAEKKLAGLESQVSSLSMAGDDIHRLQVSLQTLNKRFNKKLEEVQANFQTYVADKLESNIHKPEELANLQAALAQVKRDVEMLNELKESLSRKDRSAQESLTEMVKEVNALKTNVLSFKDSSMLLHDQLKRCEELRVSIDAIKDNLKDYEDFKKNFSTLRSAVEELILKKDKAEDLCVQ